MNPSFPCASQPTFLLVRDGDTCKRAIAWVENNPGIFVVCLPLTPLARFSYRTLFIVLGVRTIETRRHCEVKHRSYSWGCFLWGLSGLRKKTQYTTAKAIIIRGQPIIPPVSDIVGEFKDEARGRP